VRQREVIFQSPFKHDVRPLILYTGKSQLFQGYRAPQIFDEDLHIETSGVRQVINVNDRNLKQETSHSFMMSLDFNKLIGTVSTGLLVEGFYTLLESPFVNVIGTPDAEGRVIYTRRNAEHGAVVRGLNVELKIKPLSAFSLTSGLRFSQAYMISPRNSIQDNFSERLPIMATLT
jgi:outer membrane receptor for ferrienterochelin and colicins